MKYIWWCVFTVINPLLFTNASSSCDSRRVEERLRLRAGSGAGPVGEEMKRMFSYVALACGYGSPGMTSNWKHSITLNFHFPYVWMIYDEGPLSFSTRESIGVIFIVKNRYFSGFFLLFVAFICLIFSSTSFIRSMFDRLCRKTQHMRSYCKTKKW